MQVVAWASTLAYSPECDEQVLEGLLMMTLSPAATAAPLPTNDCLDLSKGYVLQPATIETAAALCMINKTNVPNGKSRSRTAKEMGRLPIA
jgi:hypothetical protein